MKHRILSVLSLLAMVLCSSTAWAERVAPTLPQSVTPQNGGCYWLYNVATGLFLGDDPASTYYAAVNLDGNDMYLEQTDDNWYLRKNAASGYYLYSYANSQACYSSNQGVHSTWTITETAGNFTLKNLSHKDDEVYLGVDDTNDVYANKTEKIEWQFMPSADAAHYVAEVKLYNALAAADDKGWAIDSYRALYDERSTATTLQLTQAAEQLVQAVEFSAYTGVFDPLNDYSKMMFYMNALNGSDSKGYRRESKFYDTYVHLYADINNSATLTAIVETTADAELFYTPQSYNDYCTMKVYVDNVLVRTIEPHVLHALNYNEDRFFEPLSVGKHLVTWEIINANSGSSEYADISKIGVVNTKPIEVHLTEPGSLGTEVLYNVDHVRDVRNLKVVGDMNEEDAVRLSMMTNMLNLDLSEATITNLPARTLNFDHTPYLHTVILPEGLKTIGERCFQFSNITTINIPSTVTTIGDWSFEYTNITEISMPDAVTSLGSYAFQGCYMLKDVHYSAGLTYVPSYAFYKCLSLNNCNLPEGITTIDFCAFRECTYGTFNPILPSTLKEIKESAFNNCNGMTEIVIPDAVTEIGKECFIGCEGLEEVTLSQNIYKIDNQRIFDGCKSLNKLTLRSATVVKPNRGITNDEYRKNITLCVPDYLKVSYKLDPYWFEFGDIQFK